MGETRMIGQLSRRRFLAISASAVAAPAFGAGGPAQWHGYALGGAASARLEGVDAATAQPAFAQLEAELARLEAIFSLFRADSAISELNRTGRLDAPPPELLEVLSLCARLHDATGGAFDPSVQPVWMLQAKAAAAGRRVGPSELEAAVAATGWKNVRFDAGSVRFRVPGMALTLNGIAQGYITDRIAAVLGDMGYGNILVDMGEIRAAGRKADGRAWVAGVATPDGALVERVTLQDRALATSAPAGTLLDADGRVGHILDPHTGAPVSARALVSVSATSAALADGLSTACCVLAAADVPGAIARFRGARLEKLI